MTPETKPAYIERPAGPQISYLRVFRRLSCSVDSRARGFAERLPEAQHGLAAKDADEARSVQVTQCGAAVGLPAKGWLAMAENGGSGEFCESGHV